MNILKNAFKRKREEFENQTSEPIKKVVDTSKPKLSNLLSEDKKIDLKMFEDMDMIGNGSNKQKKRKKINIDDAQDQNISLKAGVKPPSQFCASASGRVAKTLTIGH